MCRTSRLYIVKVFEIDGIRVLEMGELGIRVPEMGESGLFGAKE